MLTLEKLEALCVRRYGASVTGRTAIHEHLYQLWRPFQPLADSIFCDEFLGDDETKYYQRYWEMLLAHHLRCLGATIASSNEGPDFKVEKCSIGAWVEAVTPGPGEGVNRLPQEYLKRNASEEPVVVTIPHKEILLRWTTAIRAKHKRYLEYVDCGVISDSDPFVVAVNSCMLGSEGFMGISQFPNAVEATLAVGPIQVTISRQTLQAVGSGHQYRPEIANANKSDVPTGVFLDDAFSGISAIIGVHVSPDICPPEKALVGAFPFTVVHNPLAKNPLPEKWLSSSSYYVARIDADSYEVQRVDV